MTVQQSAVAVAEKQNTLTAHHLAMDCSRHKNHMSVVSFYTQRHMQWPSELALALALVLAFVDCKCPAEAFQATSTREKGKANILQVDLKSL